MCVGGKYWTGSGTSSIICKAASIGVQETFKVTCTEACKTKAVAKKASGSSGCPAGFEDITTRKQYTSAGGLEVSTLECKCKCAGGKMCSDDKGAKNAYFISHFKADYGKRKFKDAAARASALKTTRTEYEKYMSERTKAAQDALKRTVCKKDKLKKEDSRSQEDWPTLPGHMTALDGRIWTTSSSKASGNNKNKGKGRMEAYLFAELQAVVPKMVAAGDLPKGSEKEDAVKIVTNKGATIGYNGRCKRCYCATPTTKDTEVILFYHADCDWWRCIQVKITKNMDTSGKGKDQPLIRGWGKTGPYSERYIEKQRTNPNPKTLTPQCKIFRDPASSARVSNAVDALVRRAVAEFRFEAAKKIFEGKWFEGGLIVNKKFAPSYYSIIEDDCDSLSSRTLCSNTRGRCRFDSFQRPPKCVSSSSGSQGGRGGGSFAQGPRRRGGGSFAQGPRRRGGGSFAQEPRRRGGGSSAQGPRRRGGGS